MPAVIPQASAELKLEFRIFASTEVLNRLLLESVKARIRVIKRAEDRKWDGKNNNISQHFKVGRSLLHRKPVATIRSLAKRGHAMARVDFHAHGWEGAGECVGEFLVPSAYMIAFVRRSKNLEVAVRPESV